RELAWLLGLYVAEGYRRRQQVNIANTDQAILDRAEAVFDRLGQKVCRNQGSITCCSTLVSAVLDGFAMGTGAATKRLPRGFLACSSPLPAIAHCLNCHQPPQSAYVPSESCAVARRYPAREAAYAGASQQAVRLRASDIAQ